ASDYQYHGRQQEAPRIARTHLLYSAKLYLRYIVEWKLSSAEESFARKSNMFRNARSTARDPLLPTSGNGRYGGGGSLYGAAKKRGTRPILSMSFIGTVMWALASVGLIYWGRAYCARRAESSTFTCSHYMCKFEDKKGDTVELTSIPRSRLIRADMVRVRNGEIVSNYTKLKRAIQRKLGHSYAIVYMEPDSEDEDDESYDSYEDDDDSYDSYDNEEDSSEDEGDNDERTTIPPRKVKSPGKPGGRGAGAAPRVSQEEKEAAAKRRAEERARYTRERDEQRKRDGRPPLREPDQPQRFGITPEMFAKIAEEEGDDRFPGDAGTMGEKYRDKVQHMNVSDNRYISTCTTSGANAYCTWYAVQSKILSKKTCRRMRNSIHARKNAKVNIERGRGNRNTSPDDPDNKPPSPKDENSHGRLPRRKSIDQCRKYSVSGVGSYAENLEIRKGGGREISSISSLAAHARRCYVFLCRLKPWNRSLPTGMEELEESLQGLNIAKDDAIGRGGETGGAGGRRKLFAAKQPVKRDVSPRAPKKTKEEIQEGATREREAHRKGHGHHNKKARKAAHTRTIEEEEAEELGEEEAAPPAKTVHHHKGFHHSDTGYVPQEARHHVHSRYHHGSGEKKVEGGWKHQNRQWHGHEQIKKLGTRFSLGRSKARERKTMIDKYARKEIHKVEFTDSKWWNAGGVWMIILGVVSSAFCLVMGDFQPR
ncbi:unnamed protein product, partial [Ascophyllum nodosum]